MEMKYFDLIKPGTTHDFVRSAASRLVVSLIVTRWCCSAFCVPRSTTAWTSPAARRCSPLQEACGSG